MSKEYNAVDAFIEKWNVGYEDHEQKAEFAAEMKAEINQVTQDVACRFASWVNGAYTEVELNKWMPQVWFSTEAPPAKTNTQLYNEFLKTL